MRRIRRLERAAAREREAIRRIRMRREPEKVLAEEAAEAKVAGIVCLVCLVLIAVDFAWLYFHRGT